MTKVGMFIEIWLEFWDGDWIIPSIKFVFRHWIVPIAGIVTFSAFFWLFSQSLASSIFYGLFAAFIAAGCYVLNTNDLEKVENFCAINKKIAKILFAISCFGIIVKYTDMLNGEFWQIFAWPLLTASVILFILSLYEKFGSFLSFVEYKQ